LAERQRHAPGCRLICDKVLIGDRAGEPVQFRLAGPRRYGPSEAPVPIK
jgi:hypothetical protein